ncbi:2-C-methyl-D-erythritol 2,4-cyclodiphosphate synthase [bacterium]|nr:2-C-methyl-D-erythritol 2,4-cyclodiphosphate synthase [bacterium]
MYRIGQGYDVHRLVEGRKMILGGVEIPFEKGLLGHSDADVLLHAICDAMLGALALGDIGKHFPDTNESFKGISSMILLEKTNELIVSKKYAVINIDSTIVLQKPKIAPYIKNMTENISRVLKIETDAVSIKATTSEGMGFTGTGEGITAYAIVLLQKG